MIKPAAGLALAILAGLVALAPAATDRGANDPRLKNSAREAKRNGWIPVRLAGTPAEIGYQHGYLLAPEIEDNFQAIKLSSIHDSKDWNWFRTAAETVLWPHIEQQYREELQGIVAGLKARGSKLDIQDLVAMNAYMELSPGYMKWYDDHRGIASKAPSAPEHCSAFVATGSYTKDGKVVIGHNNWTDYLTAARWNVIFDIRPSNGNRILMDGAPGLIHSADDFGVNSAGIAITETTISEFRGFDPQAIPEFVRARKAMQYSSSIDDFARIMQEGNNGGYANNWLVADRNTNEIASLELGLKNVTLKRLKDGYFIGSNFPVDAKLAAEETTFDLKNMSLSPNARRVRWEALMQENKGAIDVAAGQRFLADHYDTFDKKIEPSERTLCGHIDRSARGSKPWQPEYGMAGVAQNKVADSDMIGRMSLTASFGHSCGIPFKASEHLAAHPEFAWAKPLLRDIPAEKWAEFSAK
jgi:hypothetical protein